jgi:hypothetical protein
MKIHEFKKMPISKQQNIYGGSWWVIAAIVVPLVIEGVVALSGTIKSWIHKGSGSVKTKGYSSTWKTDPQTTMKTKKVIKSHAAPHVDSNIYYIF